MIKQENNNLTDKIIIALISVGLLLSLIIYISYSHLLNPSYSEFIDSSSNWFLDFIRMILVVLPFACFGIASLLGTYRLIKEIRTNGFLPVLKLKRLHLWICFFILCVMLFNVIFSIVR